ncbi:MAG: hypothetical protein JWQ20_3878, partial [Conexibacter sp.]|nr:hypothetical protein [Conexibacter sp.]
PEIDRIQQHLLSTVAGGPDLEAAAEDLGAVVEAQARVRAEMQLVARLGDARDARSAA